MEKALERFGDFIKKIRMSQEPRVTLKELAEKMDMSLSLLSDIENGRKRPFDADKIELFCNVFDLSNEDKAYMYDLAARDKDEVSKDISEKIMYSDVGDQARIALRITKDNPEHIKKWKDFIKELEKQDNND